jgi:hypothetical protein
MLNSGSVRIEEGTLWSSFPQQGGFPMYLKSVGGLTSILLMLVCLCAASAIEIANLEVNSGLAYEVTENLGVGDKEYTDRDYTWR